MSETLTTQMHDYFAYLDEEQGAVDLVTVREPRIGDGPVRTIQLMTPSPRRTKRGSVVSGAVAAAVLVLVGVVSLLTITSETDAPPATDPLPVTTVTTPPTTTAALDEEPQWSGLTEDIPEGVESGTVTTSLGSARWVHLNSNEYLLPSLGPLSRNDIGGYTVDGLKIVVASDSRREFWESDDGITWRLGAEAAETALAWGVPFVDGSYGFAWFINTDPLEMWISEGAAGSRVDLTGLVPPASDGFTWELDMSKPLSRRTADGAIQSVLHIGFSGPDGQVDQRLLIIEHSYDGDYSTYVNVPWDVDSVVSHFGTSETLFAYVGDPNSNQVSVWRSDDGYRWTESGRLHEQLDAPDSSGLNIAVLPAIDLSFAAQTGPTPRVMRNQVVVVTTPGYGWESSDGVNWTSAPDGSPGGTDLIRLESGWFATDGDVWWMHLGDSWVSLEDLGIESAGDGCQIVPRGAGETTVFFSTGTCAPDSSQQSTTDLWIINVNS